MMQQAGIFAERLKKESGPDAQAQVQRAFDLALARSPSKGELQAALRLVQEDGLPVFCRALFNANEFVYVF